MIAAAELWKRNPIRSPTAIIIGSTTTARHRSATVRPARTAERAIGRARNRSMIPLLRSSASPTEVAAPPMSDASTNMAGTM